MLVNVCSDYKNCLVDVVDDSTIRSYFVDVTFFAFFFYGLGTEILSLSLFSRKRKRTNERENEPTNERHAQNVESEPTHDENFIGEYDYRHSTMNVEFMQRALRYSHAGSRSITW